MLFYSFEFIYLFLPVTLMAYYIIGAKRRHLAVKWIVACSLFFYGWWNPYYLFFLISSILFNYFFGLFLRRNRNLFFLLFSISVNLGFIGYFKYTGFLVSIANELAGQSFSISQIILPLGISFFTFQQISWLVDSYSGKVANQDKGLWEYGQFVTFFPQLIAGPIVHHSEMMPQFYQDKNRLVNWDNIATGISIFVVGLAKKVIIADLAAPHANMVFDLETIGKLHFADAWIGVLSYTVQIYFDFSGYADMAIGLALMFNIHLPINFDSPYKSVSISEFWRRWHMTLGRFLRDYVYIPLGGNRCGQFKSYNNLLFTMFVCGLWHGAGWTFVLWGMVHGIYLVIERLWKKFSPLRLPPVIATGLTFICVIIAWVLFRAESITDASVIILAMLNVFSEDPLFLVGNQKLIRGIYIIFAALLIVFLIPNSQSFLGISPHMTNTEGLKVKHWFQFFTTWKPNLYWAVYLTVLIFISLYFLIDQANVQEFIYFQF